MNQSTPSPSSHRPMPVQVLPDGAARKRLRRWRGFKDSAAKYSVGARAVSHVDGVSIEFDDWRFNLRMSNTEPVVRLNVESRANIPLMEEKTEELLAEMDRLNQEA